MDLHDTHRKSPSKTCRESELPGQVTDLTGFQRDLLVAVAHVDHDATVEPSGQAVKRVASRLRGDDEINHGRLYPNLDTLVTAGLVEKGQLDRRTNSYALTDRGERALIGRWEVLSGTVNAIGREDVNDTDDDADAPDGIDYATAEDAVDANRTLREAADALGLAPGRARAILLHHDLYGEVKEVVTDGGIPAVAVGDRVAAYDPDGSGQAYEAIVATVHWEETIDVVCNTSRDGPFERDDHTDEFELFTSLTYGDDTHGWTAGWSE